MSDVWVKEIAKKECKEGAIHYTGSREKAQEYCKESEKSCYEGCWGEDDDTEE